MKKILLSIGLASLALFASAQTVFNVDYPSSIGGGYDFTYAPTGTWGVADLTIAANSVVDTIAFVSDGTPEDSLGCNVLTNPTDINGKIAVVYRGDCEFGAKAKNAQDAGAVGVIIVNNIPGPPVGMAPGTFGGLVTVPTVMVSNTTGETLANAVANGDVIVFIGNKIGRFPNDLSIYQKDVRRPEVYGNVSTLSQDASEFSTEIGAWVFNYGINTQFNVELTCDVKFSGTTVYSNYAVTDSIESGDSVYIGLPDYSQPIYNNGFYSIEYLVISDSTDNSISDNEVNTGFVMNDTQISYAEIDSVTFEPIGDSYYRPSDSPSDFSMCINYRNANAGRLEVSGLTFSASTYSATDTTVNLVDEYIQIEAFKWEDNFIDFDDAAVSAINQIGSGEYDYTTDLQRENIYVNFQESFILEDNQRYLFCVKTSSDVVYLGYNTHIDYFSNQDTLDQPISIINADGTMNLRGFGTDVTPAIAVKTSIADSDNDLIPDYIENNEGSNPNDASDYVDSDNDGVPDYVENLDGTDPNDANDFLDSDNDGVSDYYAHISFVLGVEEELSGELTAFPNPAKDMISIPVGNVEVTSVVIYDVAGKVVSSQNTNVVNNNLKLDVTSISNGSYVVSLNYSNNTTANINVVISK